METPFFNTAPAPQQPKPPHKTIEDEKESIIIELMHLQSEFGKPIPEFTMASDICNMRLQLRKVKEEMEASEGIDFYQSLSLMQSGITESLNNRFNPLDLDLSGLSEHHAASIHTFRKVFRNMYRRYGTPTKHPFMEYLVLYFGMVYAFVLAKRCANLVPTETLQAAMGAGQQPQPPGQAQPQATPAGMPMQLQGMMGNPMIQQLMANPNVQQMVQSMMQGQAPPAPTQPTIPVAPAAPRREMTFTRPVSVPLPIQRQDSGISAAPTEEEDIKSVASGDSSVGGIKEISVSRGRGRGRRGRGGRAAIISPL